MDRFNYIVPGILDPVNDARTWDYQAQLWFYRRGLGISGGFNYFADVFGGLIWRSDMAGIVKSDLQAASRAQFSPIVVVGHSNGCGIIADAVTAFSVGNGPTPASSEWHLIAAAIDRDCEKNGLNAAARKGLVEKAILYVSPVDEVLGVGDFLGYGTLGKDGPVNVDPALAKILTIVTRQCGHSDWVTTNFEETMTIVAAGGVDASGPLSVASGQSTLSDLTTDNRPLTTASEGGTHGA